jgi:hypothetical protein
MGHGTHEEGHARLMGDRGGTKAATQAGEGHSPSGHYARLAAMALLSFLFMYVLMYAMVDTIGNVYPNINQFYMAGLMAAPMVVLELLLMGGMYPNRRLNALTLAASGLAFVIFVSLIRAQTAVSGREFLRSMIPHHGAAILMCERARIEDPDILDLCRRIVTGQQAEIDEMKALLGQDE